MIAMRPRTHVSLALVALGREPNRVFRDGELVLGFDGRVAGEDGVVELVEW